MVDTPKTVASFDAFSGKQKAISDSSEDIIRLTEQLKEANEALSLYSDSDNWEMVVKQHIGWTFKKHVYPWRIAMNYFERWGKNG